jgi:fucose 4-O-acetylase-like acetyltransferase
MLALSGIIVVCFVSIRLPGVHIVGTVFSEVGKASMIIMFLHQAIRQLLFYRISQRPNALIVVAGVTGICFGIYLILKKYQVTRFLFIGKGRDGR